jgi:ADP-ribose pyrophosphatase YjhB (NUDIX family)
MPGGHVKANELLIDALYRELYEETSLRAGITELVDVFEYDDEGVSTLCITYVSANYRGDIVLDENEHSEFRWMTESDIKDEKDLTPEMRTAARCALARMIVRDSLQR